MADNPILVVQSFVKAINGGDLNALRALMSDDHVFVDAQGREVAGADTMVVGWRAFFASYPQYWILVDHSFVDGDRVALFGEAGGKWSVAGKLLPETWQTRAAWLAVVEGGRVSRWSVFCDTSWVYPPRDRAPEEVPA